MSLASWITSNLERDELFCFYRADARKRQAGRW
nr:MAG TPA: hypothetical protein [Microviridae sp.]DAU54349.1 MAG TPA: hypothetical protein [Microviridae sp.]